MTEAAVMGALVGAVLFAPGGPALTAAGVAIRAAGSLPLTLVAGMLAFAVTERLAAFL